MNGAQSLIRTLVKNRVDVCFMNPGTSEIHFVGALDHTPDMRGVPCLFEGVASGAADGYARMTGMPASTLLHLGPGLSNATANLHNACRAHIPLVNIVGDHATFHRQYETPLASNVEALARPYSAWLRTSASAREVGRDCAEAIVNARTGSGHIATLVLPADTAWNDGGEEGDLVTPPAPPLPEASRIEQAAKLLRAGRVALILGGRLATGQTLDSAGRIAAATGAKLLATFAFARIERGAGLPRIDRIAYVTDQASAQLAEFDRFILVGAPPPIAFFGHPTKPSILTRPGAEVFTLAETDEDAAGAIAALAEGLDATKIEPQRTPKHRPELLSGRIDLRGLAAIVGALLPENAIVIDESVTSGRGMMGATFGAPPHDWLVNTGGSIGIGVPLAVGAAVARPDSPVLCLEADGSMYTLQALWTAAREQLAITVVIFANREYAILKGELASAIPNPGRRALDMLEIGRPDLDWVSLAKGMGVPAQRVETLDGFADALRNGFESREPNLIEVPL